MAVGTGVGPVLVREALAGAFDTIALAGTGVGFVALDFDALVGEALADAFGAAALAGTGVGFVALDFDALVGEALAGAFDATARGAGVGFGALGFDALVGEALADAFGAAALAGAGICFAAVFVSAGCFAGAFEVDFEERDVEDLTTDFDGAVTELVLAGVMPAAFFAGVGDGGETFFTGEAFWIAFLEAVGRPTETFFVAIAFVAIALVAIALAVRPLLAAFFLAGAVAGGRFEVVTCLEARWFNGVDFAALVFVAANARPAAFDLPASTFGVLFEDSASDGMDLDRAVADLGALAMMDRTLLVEQAAPRG